MASSWGDAFGAAWGAAFDMLAPEPVQQRDAGGSSKKVPYIRPRKRPPEPSPYLVFTVKPAPKENDEALLLHLIQ
jgi:hypothetical protein